MTFLSGFTFVVLIALSVALGLALFSLVTAIIEHLEEAIKRARIKRALKRLVEKFDASMSLDPEKFAQGTPRAQREREQPERAGKDDSGKAPAWKGC